MESAAEERMVVLDSPTDRRQQAVHLEVPAGRLPQAIASPAVDQDRAGPGDSGRGCRGCSGGTRAGPQSGVMEPDGSAQVRELQGRLAMLHWLEEGLEKLRREVRGRGEPEWGVHVLRSAIEGMVEVIEETMLDADEVRAYATGKMNGHGSGLACAMSRVYDQLEQKLVLHMGMEARMELEEVAPC